MTSYLSSLLCIVSQLSFCALAYLSVACNLFKMFITAGKKSKSEPHKAGYWRSGDQASRLQNRKKPCYRDKQLGRSFDLWNRAGRFAVGRCCILKSTPIVVFEIIQRILSSWALVPTHFTIFIGNCRSFNSHSLIKSTFLVSKGRLCLYDKQNITWLLIDMEFLFSSSTGHLTRLLGSLVSYWVEH